MAGDGTGPIRRGLAVFVFAGHGTSICAVGFNSTLTASSGRRPADLFETAFAFIEVICVFFLARTKISSPAQYG
jgi:hypothetical protein